MIKLRFDDDDDEREAAVKDPIAAPLMAVVDSRRFQTEVMLMYTQLKTDLGVCVCV